MEQKLKYCEKKQSNWKGSHCANIATFIVTLNNKAENNKTPSVKQYRCNSCCNTGTVHKKVISKTPIDQSLLVKEIQLKLAQYIGKEIYSSRERNTYPLIGRYIKDCGIMCNPNNNNKVWKYVYHHQITLI